MKVFVVFLSWLGVASAFLLSQAPGRGGGVTAHRYLSAAASRTSTPSGDLVQFRAALPEELGAIRGVLVGMMMNPLSIDVNNFICAEQEGLLVGFGQVCMYHIPGSSALAQQLVVSVRIAEAIHSDLALHHLCILPHVQVKFGCMSNARYCCIPGTWYVICSSSSARDAPRTNPPPEPFICACTVHSEQQCHHRLGYRIENNGACTERIVVVHAGRPGGSSG